MEGGGDCACRFTLSRGARRNCSGPEVRFEYIASDLPNPVSKDYGSEALDRNTEFGNMEKEPNFRLRQRTVHVRSIAIERRYRAGCV